MTSQDWLAGLREERSEIGRVSTAGRVADMLRAHITEGLLRPGTRLSEEDIGSALGVSRNTLREAFRLLTHERLLVHEFNRGVFVRTVSLGDVRDLYQVRRFLEQGAVRAAAREADVSAIRAAVEEGESAAAAGNWVEVGTANMHFHQALTALADSPRVDEMMSHLLAELRLVFHVIDAPEAFHKAYLGDNRNILELLAASDFSGAEAALATYFDAAEAQLIDAFEA